MTTITGSTNPANDDGTASLPPKSHRVVKTVDWQLSHADTPPIHIELDDKGIIWVNGKPIEPINKVGASPPANH